MKREELNYYDEFINMANYSVEITSTLKAFVLSYSYSQAKEIEKTIHEKENAADLNQHKILNYLIKDFVPPIDREDIMEITKQLDDVIDNIDEISIDLEILNVSTLRENVPAFVELLGVATTKLHELFVTFKDMKDYSAVKKIVIELNDIEEQADKVFQTSINELYTNEKDAINVLKWTTIYNKLEDCFDSIEHLSECVNATFVKNK